MQSGCSSGYNTYGVINRNDNTIITVKHIEFYFRPKSYKIHYNQLNAHYVGNPWDFGKSSFFPSNKQNIIHLMRYEINRKHIRTYKFIFVTLKNGQIAVAQKFQQKT